MSASACAAPPYTENTWTASPVSIGSVPAAASAVFAAAPSIQRLAALLEASGRDDYGELGPSQLAFKNALLLVAGAMILVGEDMISSPTVDSEGGIRVTWRCGEKVVKLVCPAKDDSPVYIYYASPEGNHLQNQNVSRTVLAERLRWLKERESATAR